MLLLFNLMTSAGHRLVDFIQGRAIMAVYGEAFGRRGVFLFLFFLFLGVSWTFSGTAPGEPADKGPLPAGVYRVWYDTWDRLTQLAIRLEPWEVDQREGWAILGLDAEEANRLAAEGYDLEFEPKRTDRMVRGPVGYPCYRDIPTLYAALNQLAADHPGLTQLTDFGDTWRKIHGLGEYDLYVLRLTNNQTAGPKPRFFLMANTHARELATPETAMHFIEYLLDNYDVDADATWLLDCHEIYVVVSANPDGRQLAEQGCMQRKNRNDTGASCTLCDTWGSSHYGIDLNRNNPYHWGGAGTGLCDETYQGPSAGSEPENIALLALVRSLFPDQRPNDDTSPAPPDTTGLLVSLHSYSNLVLWPWGWTSGDAPNVTALTTLGRKFAYFNGYTPEQSCDLYATTGDHTDWAYGELGIPAYTFEIGEDFFQDCADLPEIMEENLGALVYAAKVCRTPYLTPAGPDSLGLALSPSIVAPGATTVLTATINDTRYNQSNGTEPTQNAAAAEYYLDTPPWAAGAVAHPLAAADGAFNSGIEAVTGPVDTAGLALGRHLVFVRGRDTSNNWGAVSAVFLYIVDPETSPRIEGVVREAGTGVPLTATVGAGPFQTVADPATGAYSLMLPAGTYSLTAGAADHGSVTVSGVAVHERQTVAQDFLLSPIGTFFFDDVESGNLGWTVEAPWAITAEASASPSHSWTDSPGGNYASSKNISITSPVWNFGASTGVTLSFQHIYDLESTWDFGYVEYSTNGGSSWTGAASYTGTGHTVWSGVELRLAALDGQTNARLRFRFYSDTTIVKDGWHIDDIRIIASTPPLAGDLNGDGVVDAADVAILASYLAGETAGLPMGNATGDLNADAAVTPLDLVKLMVMLVE
jgi:carboxypeptidase T